MHHMKECAPTGTQAAVAAGIMLGLPFLGELIIAAGAEFVVAGAAAADAVAADELIFGEFGPVYRSTLEKAATGGGATVAVATRLSQAPIVGRTLSLATGDAAGALTSAARPLGQLFTGNVPWALLKQMEWAGLVIPSTTGMGAATSGEYRVLGQASEFIIKFLTPQ